MEYDEKVKYLSKYKTNHYRIKFINEKITSLKSIKIGEDNEYHAPGKTIEEYMDEKNELEKEMDKIAFLIDLVDDRNEKYVLGYKFIEFMTLEEIANKIGYSVGQTRRFYKKGINNIKL